MPTDGLAKYLLANRIKKLFVLGTKSLKKELKSFGFDVNARQPEFLVVGYDTEMTYGKLTEACKIINRDVPLLATHMDYSCPSSDGPIPDIGSILMMLYYTTGKKPLKVFGKPNLEMISDILSELNFHNKEVILVGDRFYTDVELAKNANVLSTLVLTGEATREMCQDSEVSPDFIVRSIADFAAVI